MPGVDWVGEGSSLALPADAYTGPSGEAAKPGGDVALEGDEGPTEVATEAMPDGAADIPSEGERISSRCSATLRSSQSICSSRFAAGSVWPSALAIDVGVNSSRHAASRPSLFALLDSRRVTDTEPRAGAVSGPSTSSSADSSDLPPFEKRDAAGTAVCAAFHRATRERRSVVPTPSRLPVVSRP